MNRSISSLAASLLAALALVALPGPATGQNQAGDGKPHIDVVFAIDCSGSMGPVIETAKQKVWTIVNEIARAKPSPVLRIGLLGYGNADQTYRKFPLSADLDEVYKNLMTFKDEGWGREYVGRAIDLATREMVWSSGKRTLRVLYVVGNETARQGPSEHDYATTAPAAIKQDIVVNAVYCGNAGGQDTWREFARLADGQYLEIAGNGGAVLVQTPYDRRLDELTRKINTTYLAYGKAGEEKRLNQQKQDENARTSGGLATSSDRAAAKASPQYDNRLWDLVDASREKGFDLSKIAEAELPQEMRAMTLAQRKAHIEKKAAERLAIQKEIQTLSRQREEHVQAELKKQSANGQNSLDAAIRKSVTEQARKKGFRF